MVFSMLQKSWPLAFYFPVYTYSNRKRNSDKTRRRKYQSVNSLLGERIIITKPIFIYFSKDTQTGVPVEVPPVLKNNNYDASE